MFDIERSQRQAAKRLGLETGRVRRSDAGRSRLPAAVLAEVRAAAMGSDRPSIAVLQRRLSEVCASQGLRTPSRTSLYAAFDAIEGHVYDIATLPEAVVECLYNLPRHGHVPGRQLVFYCFNYGTLAAMSFAAGLPWLDLHQAKRLRGWRPRSRGVLTAVLRVRDRR